MNKFYKCLTIFSLPILIVSLCFELLLREIPNNYKYKSNYLDENSKNITVLILGSSHAFAELNPAYIKYSSFNASNFSQSLEFDFKILKKYDGKWNNLKYIIVPVDYFSLYSTLENGIESWRVRNYNIYYGIHTSCNIYDNIEISNNLPANLLRINNFYLRQMSDITCSTSGWALTYSSKNKQDLLKSGKEAAERHSAKNNQYFNRNVQVLKSIIEYAKGKKVKIIFYTSPAYTTYVENLNPDQLKNTINTATKIANSYCNTVYFNLLTDSIFKKDDFFDADHLNEVGSKKFSIKMNNLIDIAEKSKSCR